MPVLVLSILSLLILAVERKKVTVNPGGLVINRRRQIPWEDIIRTERTCRAVYINEGVMESLAFTYEFHDQLRIVFLYKNRICKVVLDDTCKEFETIMAIIAQNVVESSDALNSLIGK